MVVRLASVPGLAARRNDVLFAPARVAPGPPAPSRALVYWGGDVQDYPEVMSAHRDSRRYLKWNLESTARLLSRSFPTKHIVVVRPSRIEHKCFSCYDNFVPSNDAGVPDHTPSHSALQHLQRLLEEVSNRINGMPEAELLAALNQAALPDDFDIEDLQQASQSHQTGRNGAQDHKSSPELLWWARRLALHEAALALCGFSKGCVVLNQLLHELHYTHTLMPGDDHTLRFISRIESLSWLDGGHAGAHGAWLTARAPLETLARLDVDIFVHVSPYQVRDAARPWIGREERAFTDLLTQMGAKVHRFVHEAGGAPSLHSHFAVLGDFARLQAAPAAPLGRAA